MNLKASAVTLATAIAILTLRDAHAQAPADDKAQTCQIVYEQMRQYEQSRPGTAAAFGRAFLNENCGQAFPTIVEAVRSYVAAVDRLQPAVPAAPTPAPPVRYDAIDLDRLPATGLTDAFVRQYIQRDEERYVASDLPRVTVMLSFSSIEIARPRPYAGSAIFGLADGSTVHPVRVEFTRSRSSSLRTETTTQRWDYIFYTDVDGRLKHSATLVETLR